MRVVIVPCLKDNFAYLVIDGGVAAVVDPGEAAPVEAALAREGVTLAAVWATHHHGDHVGGVRELAAARPGLAVVAGERDADRIAGVTHRLGDGDETALGSLRARAIHNPGHTLGAISFAVEDAVFTGDGGGGDGHADDATRAVLRSAASSPEHEVSESVTISGTAAGLSVGGAPLRLAASLGGGLSVTAGDAAPLLAIAARAELGLGRRTLAGIGAALWLASDVQGQVLATLARRVAPRLELGAAAGVQLAADPGPAVSLHLRAPLTRHLAPYLRYDGALLLASPRAYQSAVTLGLDYSF